MQPFRLHTDTSIDEYSNYVAKLAAVTTPGDPPPLRFCARFHSASDDIPEDELINDENAIVYLRNQAPAA